MDKVALYQSQKNLVSFCINPKSFCKRSILLISFQTIQKLSKESRNCMDNPEISRTQISKYLENLKKKKNGFYAHLL